MTLRFFLLLFPMAILLDSCYQAHSDDELRTVPVTNNPYVIQDSNRGGGILPSMPTSR